MVETINTNFNTAICTVSTVKYKQKQVTTVQIHSSKKPRYGNIPRADFT